MINHNYSTEPCSNDEWDAAYRATPNSVFFQSRLWAEIWSTYTNGKFTPAPLLIKLESEKKVVIPISKQQLPISGVIHHLSPAGTFGGWLSENLLNESEDIEVQDFLLSQVKNLMWVTHPDYPLKISTNKNISRQTNPTQRLRLTRGLDALNMLWKGKIRRNINKAIRERITVHKAKNSDDWKAFHDMYSYKFETWDTKSTTHFYDFALHEMLAACDEKDVALWLAKQNDEIVAGALCLYSKDYCVYWQASVLPEYYKMKPGNLLLSEVILDACKRGCKYFDFNPSGNLDGVRQFKLSFGAEDKHSELITTGVPVIQKLNLLRKSIF